MKLSTYLIFFLFFNLSTQAITINELTESVVFGMETSGTEACILAEIKLMEKARREVEGESITSESLKLCKSSEYKKIITTTKKNGLLDLSKPTI